MGRGVSTRSQLELPGRALSAIGDECDDAKIAVIAARQRGRVARRQLLAAGVSRQAIAVRLRAGRLHEVHPGVYAVGHPAGGIDEALMAAWLFGGARSVLTHRGAVSYWGLAGFEAVDLTYPGRRRNRGRLVFHQGSIPAGEWARRDGMRVTTLARTLLDICATASGPLAQGVFTEAEVQGVITPASIRRFLDRRPGRPGARRLRELAGLADAGASGRIRSPLEARFRRFVASERFPRPEANARIEVGGRTHEVDFLWREQRVAVELDARSTHENVERFETDRARDRNLAAHGWHPVRVTGKALADRSRLRAEFRLLLFPCTPDLSTNSLDVN